MISRTGWSDQRGNVWHAPFGPRAEPGWLVCETVTGTICFERGRWACYRFNSQTVPCVTFDALHEAANFMVETPA
jgi:hypothetical protein